MAIAAYKPLAQCGMEELAARLRVIKPSGAVLFARNADGVAKTAARQMVLDLFTPECWPDRLDMLTLPGLEWRFERKLLGLREPGWMRSSGRPKRTHFFSCENDRSISFAAAVQMPGVHNNKVKMLRFSFAEAAIKTHYGAYAFCDVEDMMQGEWRGWDAAWFDFTGQLTIARVARIKAFAARYVRSTLIITALKARWDAETTAAVNAAGYHGAWLQKELGGEVLHDIEYFDTSPMAQIAVRWT